MTRWIFVATALATAACGPRPHLIDGHGTSYRAAFAAQAPPRADGPAQASVGLDSQEAAIVAHTYRAGLAPKDERPKEQPVLVVTPPSRDAPQKLAPSVPQER